MQRPRNTQYKKFWHAQYVLSDISRDLKTERGVSTFVRKACERAYLKRRYPLSTSIEVYFNPNEVSVSRYSITLNKGEFKEHALARHIARAIWYRQQPYGSLEWAQHGPEFCGIFLDVVRALMGPAASEMLKNSFKAHGVRFKPKKKVVVTQEMRERLAAARAKRESINAEEA